MAFVAEMDFGGYKDLKDDGEEDFKVCVSSW